MCNSTSSFAESLFGKDYNCPLSPTVCLDGALRNLCSGWCSSPPPTPLQVPMAAPCTSIVVCSIAAASTWLLLVALAPRRPLSAYTVPGVAASSFGERRALTTRTGTLCLPYSLALLSCSREETFFLKKRKPPRPQQEHASQHGKCTESLTMACFEENWVRACLPKPTPTIGRFTRAQGTPGLFNRRDSTLDTLCHCCKPNLSPFSSHHVWWGGSTLSIFFHIEQSVQYVAFHPTTLQIELRSWPCRVFHPLPKSEKSAIYSTLHTSTQVSAWHTIICHLLPFQPHTYQACSESLFRRTTHSALASVFSHPSLPHVTVSLWCWLVVSRMRDSLRCLRHRASHSPPPSRFHMTSRSAAHPSK